MVFDPTSTIDARGPLPVAAVGDLVLDDVTVGRRDSRRALRRAHVLLDLLRRAGATGQARVSVIGHRVPVFGFEPISIDVTGAAGAWRLDAQSNARGAAVLGDRFAALMRVRDVQGRTGRADAVLSVADPRGVVRGLDNAQACAQSGSLPGGGRVAVDRFAPGGVQARVWTYVDGIGDVDLLVADGEVVLLAAGVGRRRIEKEGPLGLDLVRRWDEAIAGTDLVETWAAIPHQVVSSSDALLAGRAQGSVRT